MNDCPWGDPNEPPDLAKARQMLKDAGVDGTKVTVWGNNDDPTDKVTEAYADQLNKMGFNADAADHRRRRLLPDDRQREDEAADRLRQLVRRLPAPEELHVPRGRQVDPADQQPELRQRRRSGDHGRHRAAEQAPDRRQDDARSGSKLEQRPGRGAAGSLPTATASWRRSCRSGWTSTTATSSIRSTTTTTRASASSRPE